MLISLRWLQRYIDVDRPASEIGDILTMAGYPVVSIENRDDGDVCMDVEVTSNRPDLQSHIGVARELAAALRTGVRIPDPSLPEACDDRIDVAVEAPDLCPLYTARVIRGVSVGPSPDWLRSALEAVGQRSVNNVVDVTNFVLLECGHPLHAFDLAQLAGPRLVARRAEGEELTAIDGTLVEIGPDECAISDASRPVALGGVMGGSDSEVSDATTDIALECALFAPLAIRGASRRHQIRSESSFRFERFVDPAAARWASDRAAALLVDVCGASAVGPICSAGPGRPVHSAAIALRAGQVTRILGIEVPEHEVRDELSALGLEELPADTPGTTQWRAPSWRADLVEEIDLVEEVSRRIGFDRIPTAVGIPVRPRTERPRDAALLRLRESLVQSGLRECCTAPFVGEGPSDIALLDDGAALRVTNPMRADESLLRRSVLGPLLLVARGNQDRGADSYRLFETAPVYLRSAGDAAPREMLLSGVVVTGGYADVKGVLDRVIGVLGVADRVTFARGAPRPLRMEESATVRLDGELLGHVGRLHDRDRQAFGLQGDVSILEVRADLLADAAVLERPYRKISRFPAVERDLAVVLADDVTWAQVEAAVVGAGGALVASVRPFDVYRGEQVGAGRKSLALRMSLRSAERTLTGEEVDGCVAAVVAALEEHCGGTLRV